MCRSATDRPRTRDARIAWAKVTPRSCLRRPLVCGRRATDQSGRAPAVELPAGLVLRQLAQIRLACGTRSISTYGCFLPDLTRFVALRRAGPDRQRRLTRTVPNEPALEQEFNPAVADCGFRAPLAPRLAQPTVTVRHENPTGQATNALLLRVGLACLAMNRHQQVARFHSLTGYHRDRIDRARSR